MRAALASSLEHVFSVGVRPARHVAMDVWAALTEIRNHRILPGIFGRYYELILAVRAGLNNDASALFDEIIELASQRLELTCVMFSSQELGADMDRYNRLLDLAAETPTLLAQPSSEQWPPFASEVATALDMIERADAELAGELRALVIQIVGAVSPTAGAGREFDGASSFMLWGAICINIARHPTALDLVGALVHEATHQLLFGLSREEPLLDNLTDGRFESPLRRDPRPMVGVFHGTFVCARMYYVYRRLLDSRPGLLQAAEVISINQRLDEQRRRFFCGLETVQDHGRLTAAGACLLNSAQEFIEYDTA